MGHLSRSAALIRDLTLVGAEPGERGAGVVRHCSVPLPDGGGWLP